jgi:hypothetical protein
VWNQIFVVLLGWVYGDTFDTRAWSLWALQFSRYGFHAFLMNCDFDKLLVYFLRICNECFVTRRWVWVLEPKRAASKHFACSRERNSSNSFASSIAPKHVCLSWLVSITTWHCLCHGKSLILDGTIARGADVSHNPMVSPGWMPVWPDPRPVQRDSLSWQWSSRQAVANTETILY